MSSLYDEVRASVDTDAQEERVEVNQRALIDKILARYASAGAVYRELLQNSNDAEATKAEVHFTTETVAAASSTTNGKSTPVVRTSRPIVKSVEYRNNGLPFRPQDWSRLKKIAEGNPDESKIGAFGVGAYTMFSICEEPIVLSGNQALAFVWKGDALWTRTIDNKKAANQKGWTSFILPSRDPYPLPDLQEFGEFLCAALTFTKCLSQIRLFVDGKERLHITKTLVQEPSVVQIPTKSSWWKSDGAITASPNGLFRLRDEQALLESFYHMQVTLDGETAALTARYLSATAKTKIPANMVKRMERVTKKKPPSKVEVQIFLNSQRQDQLEGTSGRPSKAQKILQSFSPRIGEGRIFIGFRTSQTTGLAAHLAAPFVPTVEREAMDLQDQTLRVFNTDLLEFSGILMRLTLEHGMIALGEQFSKGAKERAELEAKLLKEEERKAKEKKERRQQPSATPPEANAEGSAGPQEAEGSNDDGSSSTKSRLWGFAKFMAKGVQKTIVKVVNTVEDLVDDGGELMQPFDPRPLCTEEHQAILLMQSFCPRQSTPDPKVGTALAQGFSRCLPDQSPPVLTRTGVISGDQARLPFKGIEAFRQEAVVRSIVYKNAEEYHDVIAQCTPLHLDDLLEELNSTILTEAKAIRLLKWWVRFSKVQPHVTSRYGLRLKESIKFCMDYTGPKTAAAQRPEFRLADFLFYLDKDRIRSTGGYTVDTLPMPDSLLPKTIQDSVTVRSLTDVSLRDWFEALPIEIWVDFICRHPCMTSGQPEDEKLRVQVLSTLSQEYSRRSIADRPIFGSYCQSVLKDCRCIPFDSSIPTSFSADSPSNLYLFSAELEAFDGIGNFHKVSQSLQHKGITDEFLVALGVRKSVAIDFLFANLDTLKWNSDPKPLVEYLRTATLTGKDHVKLKTSQYLPCENDVSRMFAPHELYLPDRDLRIFSFLRLLQWPSQEDMTERSENGRFLVELGMKMLPPLTMILQHASTPDLQAEMRVQTLEFVTKRLGTGGAYRGEYSRLGRSQRAQLNFLPCVVKSPLDGRVKNGLYSVLTCCSEARCGVMGFPIIDPALGESAQVFGSLFQCVTEPDPKALIQQLLLLVSTAKQLLRKASPKENSTISKHILVAFTDIFQYLSSRTSEITASSISGLEQEDFIPCEVNEVVQWFSPSSVFFKPEEGADDTVTESLFQVVDFSPFLAAAGVRQEASTKDIFQLMIRSPQAVFSAVKSEEKYRLFLRRVAANRPFRRVTNEIRQSPFLLAYSVNSSEGENNEKASFELARAEEIFIIDNSFFGRMFPVKRAPHESDLEDFYALIGSKYISKEVGKNFDVIGDAKRETVLTRSLLERIQERSPLLVSPSVTSRPLVSNAASVLSAKNLQIHESQEVKAVYTLNKSTRRQKTTCCSKRGPSKKNILYVTADFDWFDVGYAIGELILQRCQLEDAFFISSLLEAPLEQLRARGFPVDRIIKPEPVPELKPEPVAASTANNHRAEAIASSEAGVRSAEERKPSETKAIQDTTTKSSPVSASTNDNTLLNKYVEALKQMYPTADENYIRQQLGPNPSMEQVQSLAEKMAINGFPEKLAKAPAATNEDPEKQTMAPAATIPPAGSQPDQSKNKFFGSKKLGRALNGLRGGAFGGLNGPAGDKSRYQNQVMRENDRNSAISPETDSTSQHNLERMLKQTVNTSKGVDPSGVASEDKNISIPEGLDKGDTCEAIPGQDLEPFLGVNAKGQTHNGIKVFSARKHSESHDFLLSNTDVVESFAVVLERLCDVFNLELNSIAIFHDPNGGVIAFNLNRALHFNVRFFYALHYSSNKHHTQACYSYWFVTFCHELAHHMVSAHNKEHGFYTESFLSLYLPKVTMLMSQLQA